MNLSIFFLAIALVFLLYPEASDANVRPRWCDPTKPMGAWLNFKNIRKICGQRGFKNFGPYGGVPTSLKRTTKPPKTIDLTTKPTLVTTTPKPKDSTTKDPRTQEPL